MDKHLQLIIVLVRLCGIVLVPFSRIYAVSCKFHSFTSPEPGLCVRVQRVQMRSAVNVKDKAQVQRTPKQVLQWFWSGGDNSEVKRSSCSEVKG